MRWELPQTRIRYFGALIFGIVIGVLAAPLWRAALVTLNQDTYGELTYRCDSAMRTHYLAKARINTDPSHETVGELRQAEVALIDCQDYDLLQKRLQMWGLRETELGIMRLRAIEADADGLRHVVDIHEIRD